jgi:CubicO group peptidase (beta-lactamase class C family)
MWSAPRDGVDARKLLVAPDAANAHSYHAAALESCAPNCRCPISSKENVVLLKKVMFALIAIVLWVVIAAYGAISGWWLTPIAPKGDTQAFWNAAIELAKKQSRGNVALVLIRNGEVHDRHYAASVDAVDGETVFPLASMSKWFTAYAVMQLVQAGKIDLDAPVSRYLKRWQLPEGPFDRDGVTVRRLLSHTAGLTDGLGFGDYAPDEALPELEASLRQPRASSGTRVIAVGQEPGSAWKYSGGGYLILQLLIEEVSGMGFVEWMQQAVFDPIGMQRSTYAYIGDVDNASRSYAADGSAATSYRYAAAAATGLSSSADDLVKFAQAQLHADRLGAQVLNQASVDAMRLPHGQKFGADIWGLGTILYAPTAGGGHVFGHDGSNAPAINTALRINPDNGDAIIVLVTGHRTLATSLAYEWTLWQTGVPDFLLIDKALESALMPMLIGVLIIVALFVYLVMARRRKAEV